MEVISFDFNQSLELGELYLMILSPLIQSSSYNIRDGTSSIISTDDTIFVISDLIDSIELQLRSVYLGEDRLVGRLSIHLE